MEIEIFFSTFCEPQKPMYTLKIDGFKNIMFYIITTLYSNTVIDDSLQMTLMFNVILFSKNISTLLSTDRCNTHTYCYQDTCISLNVP